MPVPKPPPRTWKPDEERKVQLFLERSAPIVLEDPALTSERWERMAQIAAELELTAEQFRSTLDDLLHRGVIQRIDVKPPAPPPLPPRKTALADSTISDEIQEEAFALTPPQVAPPPRRAVEAPSDSPSVAREPLKPTPTAKSTRDSSRPGSAGSDELMPSPAGESRLAPAPSDLNSTRWRVEGEPSPAPPSLLKKPHETFLDYVRRSLDFFSHGAVISEELNQRWMAHGTRVLTLSTVYARHLVNEVLQERGLSLAPSSHTPTQPAATNGDVPKADPTSSRPAPTSTVNGTTPPALARDQLLQERRAAFLDYLQRSLDKTSPTILGPQLVSQLTTTGNDLFGLENNLALETIREASAPRKITVLTAEQAQANLDQLIEQLLVEEVVLAPHQCDRLYQAANQWGFTRSQVDTCVQKHTEINRQHRRRESIMTAAALSAATIAVVGVVLFLGYAFIGNRPGNRVPSVSPTPDLPPQHSETNSPEATWETRIAFSVEQARKAFPYLSGALLSATHPDVERRQAAQEAVVEHFLGRIAEDTRRQLLFEVLYQCLSGDPSDECAAHTAKALLKTIPSSDAKIPENPADLQPMFWAVRTTTRALTHGETRRARTKQLAELLNESLAVNVNVDLPPETVEKEALTSLADLMFRMLISASTVPGADAAKLHSEVSSQVAGFIDSSALDNLNAEFLSAVLVKTPDAWRSLEGLLKQTAESSEPDAMLVLLNLYETTPNRELQSYLGGRLIARTKSPSEEWTVEEVIQHVREDLNLPKSRKSGDLP